jgi:hypothetical protein
MDLIIMTCINKRTKSKLYSVILLLAFLFFGCKETTSNTNRTIFVKDENITEANFRQLNNRYIIKFSNVWDNFNNRLIKIPIFKGTEGDVQLNQLERKQKMKDVSIMGGIIIETGKGKVRQGVLECVSFYKKSLLKNVDIHKPSIIGVEPSGMFIWYDFDYEGIPGTLMIGVAYDPDCETKKSMCRYEYLEDIEVNENANGFRLSINFGERSQWYRKGDK